MNLQRRVAIGVGAAVAVGAVVLAVLPFQTLYEAAPLAPAGRRTVRVQCSAPMFSAFGRVGHAHERIFPSVPPPGPTSPGPWVLSTPEPGACERPARHRLAISVALLVFTSLLTVASFSVLRELPARRLEASPI